MVNFFAINWWLGIKLWIWLYFALSIVLGIIVSLYFFRERLKKNYYKMRFPEKLIKVIIHYPNNYYKIYWRLIPSDNLFSIDKMKYEFTGKNVQKENDFFGIKQSDKEWKIKIDGKEYLYNVEKSIKLKKELYPEIHYFHNSPSALEFDISKRKIDLSATQLEEFKENDLFSKLLTLETEKTILMIILIFVIINICVSVFIVAKLMGWLK